MKQIKRYVFTIFFSFLAGFLIGHFATPPRVEYVKINYHNDDLIVESDSVSFNEMD